MFRWSVVIYCTRPGNADRGNPRRCMLGGPVGGKTDATVRDNMYFGAAAAATQTGRMEILINTCLSIRTYVQDDVDCGGRPPPPSHLHECKFRGWYIHNCVHSEVRSRLARMHVCIATDSYLLDGIIIVMSNAICLSAAGIAGK